MAKVSINWGVSIDITDATSDTSADIGLYSGVFYWITGRPGYAGSGYSGEAPASKTWKQGIITSIDKISPIIRKVKDMEITGGYGSLSGFRFEVNDTGGLNTALEANDYFVINRNIDVYCFLDDASYHVWGGVVAEVNKSGPVLQIVCEDDFKNIHLPMPPDIITATSFPEIQPENAGDPIPISFGNLLRSKVLPVTGKISKTILGNIQPDDTDSDVTAAVLIDVVSNSDYRIEIKTPYKNFQDGYFKDSGVYYIRVIKGGSQSIRILDSEATENPGDPNATTKLVLAKMFDGVTVSDFNSENIYTGDPLLDDIWLFQVLKMDVKYITSSKTVFQHQLFTGNRIDLVQFDKDRKVYEPIDVFGEDSDVTTNNVLQRPYITILNNDADVSGEISLFVPLVPSDIVFAGHTSNGPTTNTLETNKDNLLDRDRTTYAELAGVTGQSATLRYRVKFPERFLLDSFTKLYLMIDFEIIVYVTEPPPLPAVVNPSWNISTYGPFNSRKLATETAGSHGENVTASTLQNFNYLPNEYYKNGGNDNGEDSFFHQIVNNTQVSEKFLISDSVMSTIVEMPSQWFEFELVIPSHQQKRYTVKMAQIGFMGVKNINTIQNDIFVKIKGETL